MKKQKAHRGGPIARSRVPNPDTIIARDPWWFWPVTLFFGAIACLIYVADIVSDAWERYRYGTPEIAPLAERLPEVSGVHRVDRGEERRRAGGES